MKYKAGILKQTRSDHNRSGKQDANEGFTTCGDLWLEMGKGYNTNGLRELATERTDWLKLLKAGSRTAETAESQEETLLW